MTPYFFGYGSLVNVATHAYPDPQPAQLRGWQRRWVKCPNRSVVYLSVEPADGGVLDGLIAAVPDADWAALDQREAGYARVLSGADVVHGLGPETPVAHYRVAAENIIPTGDHVILLSYLDVVVQGYHRVFGAAGVADFFDTTQGWAVPVLDDRAAPRYPRAQPLSAEETRLVDQHLAAVR